MTDKIESGKRGEELAATYLQGKGYEILERNYRYRRGEIDIISKKENLLVFVEVKLRAGVKFGNPEESVGNKKEEMVMMAAENYIYERNWKGDLRFDVISITGKNELMHFEDAFGY